MTLSPSAHRAKKFAMTKVYGIDSKNISITILTLSSAMAFVRHVQRNCIRNYITKKWISLNISKVNLTISNYFLIGFRKVFKPGKKALMPWEYGIGHLFKTVEKVVVDQLGEVGDRAVNAGLVESAKQYGEQAAQKVVAYRNTDF